MPIYDQWILADPSAPPHQAKELSPTIGMLAARRCGADDLQKFLHPSMDDLHDASAISGMPEACARIAEAVRAGEQILIYGDYDCDGVTSILLLRYAIGALGGRVDHVVPHRLVDGYGLRMSVLERVLAERDVRLVITVDCGITSVEPVEAAISRGIDVIITDHHLPPGELPRAVAVLNPRKPGCEYPFKELAGAGVALKLACELLRRSGRKVPLESLLRIAAIGTIADVAPLVGENRTIARIGLRALSSSRNHGLRAILAATGIAGRPLRAADVGFRIGPRINAAGRIASADTAIELFSCSSATDALRLVEELERLNSERRAIEKKVLADAEAFITNERPRNGYLVAGSGWHRGVLGLCAGRLAQSTHRPVLVVSIDGDECVGSGRSVAGVDLHAILHSMRELFTHFGGHEYACGFTFPVSLLDQVRERFREAVDSITPDLLTRNLQIDAEVSFGELTPRFLGDLLLLEPFGAGNPRPVFRASGVCAAVDREFSAGCFAVTLRQHSESRSAVVWPSAAALLEVLRRGGDVDVAFAVEPDRWGRMGMQLELLDARAAAA